MKVNGYRREMTFWRRHREWERVSPSVKEQKGRPVQKEKHVQKTQRGRKFGDVQATKR